MSGEQVLSGRAGQDGTALDFAAPLSDRWSKQRGYGVTVGGVNILLPVGAYSELTFDPVITALPNAPQYFVGLLNMRGNLIPVYDLALYMYVVEQSQPALIDLSKKIIKKPQVVVLGKGDDSVALLCDNLPDTLELSIDALRDANDQAPAPLQPFVSRSFWLNNTWWFELDIVATFTFLAQEHSL